MAKKKTHEFVIRVTFNKPCTGALALAEVKDNIHGDFYTNSWFWSSPGPDQFKVKTVKRQFAKKRKAA